MRYFNQTGTRKFLFGTAFSGIRFVLQEAGRAHRGIIVLTPIFPSYIFPNRGIDAK
jgi:hypothetical protein